MAPKVKVTREDIINTATDAVRKNGVGVLNARSIAAILGCSTQPIFSNFENMDKLRIAVVERAYEKYALYVKTEMESGKFPVYKASGMAYISFAKHEKELFKLLFMRDRTNEDVEKSDKITDEIFSVIQKETGLDSERVKLFHLEMWAYVHGIASMLATGFIELDWELVSSMMTDAYLGLRKQFNVE